MPLSTGAVKTQLTQYSMGDEHQDITEQDVVLFHKEHKEHVRAISKEFIPMLYTASKSPYTELKAWFIQNSPLKELKCNGMQVLVKYIISYAMLYDQQNPEDVWNTDVIFGLSPATLIAKFIADANQAPSEHIQSSASSSYDSEHAHADGVRTTNRPKHYRMQQHVIAEDSEEELTASETRMVNKLFQKLQLASSSSSSMQHVCDSMDTKRMKHGKSAAHVQRSHPMDDLQQAYEVDAPEVDDDNVLYFPRMWPQLSNVSNEERRTLLKTLKEAAAIQHPKHKDKQYQVEHLLRVLRCVLKDQPEEACKAIADRLLFLNHSAGKNLEKAISFYEHVTTTVRPKEYKDADILSNLPRQLTGKQHQLLSQKFKGDKEKGDNHPDTAGDGAAGSSNQRQDSRFFRGGKKRHG